MTPMSSVELVSHGPEEDGCTTNLIGVVHGLSARPDLNNELGHAVQWIPEKERWAVLMVDTGERVLIRDENVDFICDRAMAATEQLLRHLTPEASKQYLVDHKINDQLLSSKPGVRENALLRMVAACNSTFMQTVPVSTKPSARAVAEPDAGAAAPKRKRTAEPPVAAAPVAMPPLASDATGDADLLRQALAAQYNC